MAVTEADIRALRDGIAKLQPLIQHIPKLEKATGDLKGEVAALRTVTDSLHERCPHREDIARGANNVVRVKKIEELLMQLTQAHHDDIMAIKDLQATQLATQQKQHSDDIAEVKEAQSKDRLRLAIVMAAAGMAGTQLGNLISFFS